MHTEKHFIKNPVFIVGITGRSGTNYLSSLLKTHPDCESSSLMAEDFIIYGLDKLTKFSDKISNKWKKEWNYHPDMQNQLNKSLGDGMSMFLANNKHSKCIVSKTPSTMNIDKLFNFFPEAKLIIIIRDGRDVVESGVNSNFWNYEMGFHIWDASASRIHQFIKKNESFPEKFLLVKYEDLINSLDEELVRIFDFCNLPSEEFDLQEAKDIKLLGSSIAANPEKKEFKWEIVNNKSNFNPLNRSQNWKRSLHYRYNRKCGGNTQKFGYPIKHPQKGFRYYSTNLLWDLRYFYIKLKYAFKPI